MLLIAQVSHVTWLPWQQQQTPLQWLITPAIQVITGHLTCYYISKQSVYLHDAMLLLLWPCGYLSQVSGLSK